MSGRESWQRRYVEAIDEIDYDEYLRMARAGLVEIAPPLDSDTIFDPQFERRANELNRKPFKGAAVTSIVPQRQGPWSGSNSLGISQPFQPAANNQQTILKLDEWDFPQVWSLMLSIDMPDTDTGQFAVIAKIRNGVGGFTDEFEMDWTLGTSITLCANAINVIAAYEDVVGTIPDGVRLNVLASKRPLDGTAPTRTVRFSIAAGDSAVVRIPKYAKNVRFIEGVSTLFFTATTTMLFTYGTAGGGTAAAWTGATLLTQHFNNVPIVGSAKGLAILNGGGSTINFQAIFELGL